MEDTLAIVFLGRSSGTDETLFLKRYKYGTVKMHLKSKISKSWKTVMRLEDVPAHLDIVARLVEKDAFGADQIREVQVFVPGVPTVLLTSSNFAQDEKAQEAIWDAIQAWYGQEWRDFSHA